MSSAEEQEQQQQQQIKASQQGSLQAPIEDDDEEEEEQEQDHQQEETKKNDQKQQVKEEDAINLDDLPQKPKKGDKSSPSPASKKKQPHIDPMAGINQADDNNTKNKTPQKNKEAASPGKDQNKKKEKAIAAVVSPDSAASAADDKLLEDAEEEDEQEENQQQQQDPQITPPAAAAASETNTNKKGKMPEITPEPKQDEDEGEGEKEDKLLDFTTESSNPSPPPTPSSTTKGKQPTSNNNNNNNKINDTKPLASIVTPLTNKGNKNVADSSFNVEDDNEFADDDGGRHSPAEVANTDKPPTGGNLASSVKSQSQSVPLTNDDEEEDGAAEAEGDEWEAATKAFEQKEQIKVGKNENNNNSNAGYETPIHATPAFSPAGASQSPSAAAAFSSPVAEERTQDSSNQQNQAHSLLQVRWQAIQRILISDAALIAGPSSDDTSNEDDDSICATLCSCLFEKSHAERDLPVLMMMGKIPMAHNNPHHENLMKSIRVALHQLSVERGVVEATSPMPSYHALGFQSNDPANDLRGTGMLGLLQWYFLIKRHPELAGPIWLDSQSESHGFQFALASFEMTSMVLQVMRTGELNPLIDEREKAILQRQKEMNDAKGGINKNQDGDNNNIDGTENNGSNNNTVVPSSQTMMLLFAHDLYVGLMRHFHRVWKSAPTRQVMDFPPIRTLLKKIIFSDPVSIMYSSPAIPLAPTTFSAVSPAPRPQSSPRNGNNNTSNNDVVINNNGKMLRSKASAGAYRKTVPPSPTSSGAVKKTPMKLPPKKDNATPRNGGGGGGTPKSNNISLAKVGAASKDDEGFSSI